MRRLRLIALLVSVFILGFLTASSTAFAGPKPEVIQPCPGLVLPKAEIDAFCAEKTPAPPTPGERSRFGKGPQP